MGALMSAETLDCSPLFRVQSHFLRFSVSGFFAKIAITPSPGLPVPKSPSHSYFSVLKIVFSSIKA